MSTAVLETRLPEGAPTTTGKVRDMYDLGERMVIVTTDRVSAYDVVNPVGIPDKGKILTAISLFWFEQMKDLVPNHLISADLADFPAEFQACPELFEGRSMLVRKCEMLPVEFVIRGYLAGSGWKEYAESETVCGIRLPSGLGESAKLETPIYTPATKATDGHDINISPDEAGEIIGVELNDRIAEISQAIYARGRDLAAEKGIILCDTKFEFGLLDGELILADEVLTPDSSRFWPADDYEVGRAQQSYDKQFVRDYLAGTGWDKTPPAPALPDDVIAKTREKYFEAYHKLTGKKEL